MASEFEKGQPTWLEQQAYNAAFMKTAYTKGSVTELANLADDEAAGYKKIHSGLTPLIGEGKISEILNHLIPVWTNGKTRKEVDKEFAAKPGLVRKEDHHKVSISEWPTTEPNVAFGIKEISYVHGEKVRTYYLRNRQEKKGFLHRILKSF